MSIGLIVAINPVKQFERSRDTARKAAVKQLHSAIQNYIIKYGSAPPNKTTGAYCSNNADFLDVLITSGELKSIPKPQGNTHYCYYNYGPNNNIGAMVVATLESIDATTTPPEGTCRPFTNNWCSSTIASKQYCLCLPH